MRRSAVALLGVLVLQGVALADTGVELGPVLESSSLGLRGGIESGIFVLAAERYDLTDGARTRAELAVRLPLPAISRFRLEPQVGLLPAEYETRTSGASAVSIGMSATIALTVKLGGPLWLALEPLRFERRLAQWDIHEAPAGSAAIDHSRDWRLSSWIGLRLGW